MKRIATILLLCLLAGAVSAGPAYMQQITFPGYTRSETLTNFPALVTFTNYTGFLSTNGYDLRFWTNATFTGTPLNYEIDTWNTAGSSYVWVQVPTLAIGTSIWATWGDPLNTSQQAYTTNGATWNSGYAGVWHLAQTNAFDSTVNTNNLANTSVTTTNNGPFGAPAAHFSGNPSKLEIASSASLTLPVTITMSTWVRYTSIPDVNYACLIEKQYSPNYDYCMMIKKADDKLSSYFYFTGVQRSIDGGTGAAIAPNVWTHLESTWDGVTIRTYINGATNQALAASSYGWTGPDGIFDLGHSKWDSGRWLIGDLGETRVSSVARDANWVWAEYMNMASNTVFNLYGPVKTASTAASWGFFDQETY